MRTPNNIKNIEHKLNSNTIIDEITGCWLFQGSINKKGYGHIRFNARVMEVHRVSAHLFLGLIFGSGEHALHKLECPNKNCWNPDHLYVGTNDENIRDRQLLGHTINNDMFKTHCIWNHEFTKENTFIDANGKRNCRTCWRNRKTGIQ